MDIRKDTVFIITWTLSPLENNLVILRVMHVLLTSHENYISSHWEHIHNSEICIETLSLRNNFYYNVC